MRTAELFGALMKFLRRAILILLALQAASPAFRSALAQPANISAPPAISALQSSQPPASTPDTTAPATPPQSSEKKVTAYTLPPDLYRKARDLGRFHARFAWIDFFYGIFVLWVILYWRFGPQFRDWAESVSRNRFLQAAARRPRLALEHLRKFRRTKVRAQHSELGLLVLGLDQRTVSRNPAGNYSDFDSLRRDSQQPAPLVVLFLAGVAAHYRDSRFHSAGDRGPHVPQIRAAAAKRSRAHRQPGNDGTARRCEYSTGAHVLDGCGRKNHGAECLRHRHRRVKTHRGVGHHHRQNGHPANCSRRGTRDGPLRSQSHLEGSALRCGIPLRAFLSRLPHHRLAAAAIRRCLGHSRR